MPAYHQTGCPGAAAFLEALPKFATPAPPTPMADIVAEMDADYQGLPTKLMAAVNKPGSPCKARARMQHMMHLACVSHMHAGASAMSEAVMPSLLAG